MKIRILPMSSNNPEFIGKDIKQVQDDYFMDYLKNEKGSGWYWYETSGISAEEGDLILFQMNSSIIASAIFDMDLPNPTKAFIVKPNTIKVFKPIEKEELSGMIDDFKRFGDAKPEYEESQVNMKRLIERMNEHNK